MLTLRDIAGDSKQLHGSASGIADDRTLHHNPALLTGLLLIRARSEAVFCPTAAARTFPAREGTIQIGKILGMDLRPHLRKVLWRCVRTMPVNMPIARVIFEPTAL
jgi:hypothetical protein